MSPANGSVTMQASRTQPGRLLESAGTHRPMNTPGPGSGRDANRQTNAENRVHSKDKVQPSPGREGTPSQGEPLESPSLSIKRLQAQVVETDLELLLSHAGQDTQVSEGQREWTIKKRVSGEQTVLGGAEPKGAGTRERRTGFLSPDSQLARRPNQSILKEISPGYSLEGLMMKLKP